MIRFLRQLIWFEWRLFVNGLKGGRRRDAIEQASRTGSAFLYAFMAIFLAGAAGGLSFLGLIGGFIAADRPADGVLLGLRAIGFFFLAASLLPQSAGRMTSPSGHPRFLLFPVSRRALHAAEVLANGAGPGIVILVPGVFFFALALALGGRPLAGLLAFLAGAAFTFFLAASVALMAFLGAWLFRDRRRGELLTLVSLIVLSFVSFIPSLISNSMHDREGSGLTSFLRDADRRLPSWTRVLPSELYGATVRSALGGGEGEAGVALLALVGEGAVIMLLSAGVYRKVLEVQGSGGRRRRTRRAARRDLTFPFFSPAASAVAITQARTALRSVRGRYAVLFPGVLWAFLAAISLRFPAAIPGGSFLGTRGDLLFGLALATALRTLQPFHLNQFASDRGGLVLQFLAPIAERDLVLGKALGCGLLYALAAATTAAAMLLVGARVDPAFGIAMLLGAIATYLLLCPFAVFFSAYFPKRSDFQDTRTGGNPHGLASLVGMILLGAFVTPPFFFIRHAQGAGKPDLALFGMAAWTVAAALVAFPLLVYAASTMLPPRRENLALVAEGR